MGRIVFGIIKGTLAVLGALLFAGAATGPEDALPNIAAWAKVIGLDRLSAALAAVPHVNLWAAVLGLLLAGVSAGLWYRGRRKGLLAPFRDEEHRGEPVALAAQPTDYSAEIATFENWRLRQMAHNFADELREFAGQANTASTRAFFGEAAERPGDSAAKFIDHVERKGRIETQIADDFNRNYRRRALALLEEIQRRIPEEEPDSGLDWYLRMGGSVGSPYFERFAESLEQFSNKLP